MTVIYVNWEDEDTRDPLSLFKDLGKFIEIDIDTQNAEEIVNEAIISEQDTLIFFGHGSCLGLMYPDYNYGTYLLHENNVNLIKAKNIIACWCNASTFCQNNNLKNCFATSMFITNVKEAYDNCIYKYSQKEINETSFRFYQELVYLIKENVPMNEWVMRLGAHMDIENLVDTFNRQGIQYYGY